MEAPSYDISCTNQNNTIWKDIIKLESGKPTRNPLKVKLPFSRDHFLYVTKDGFVTRPRYNIDISFSQMYTTSHKLRIETDGYQRLGFHVNSLKLETKEYYTCICLVYYEI